MPHAIPTVPRHSLTAAILIGLACTTAIAAIPTAQPANSPSANHAKPAQNYGNLPLSFEANRGQTDPTVKFVSRGSGYSLYLTDSAAVLALSKGKSTQADTIHMELANANPQARATGTDQLPGAVNYFLGNDPAQWRSNIPTYAKVRYTGVYPGVDLVYYGNQHRLEYDFIVAPNADANNIRFNFTGQKSLKIASNGDLILQGTSGQTTLQKPVIYQEKDGQRRPIPGSFQLAANHSVRFHLGSYDHSQPLIIDPVLVYATYLGGSTADAAVGIAIDSTGSAYILGTTKSPDFPVTSGVYDNTLPPGGGTFVSKLNPAGTALVYSTFFGVGANAIAVDSLGDAYIAGSASSGLPVTSGAYQTTNNGAGNGLPNAFVVKLNPTGSALLYATYLGGSGGSCCTENQNEEPFLDVGDEALTIAVDASGDAYVAGQAGSADFPVTAGALQAINKAAQIRVPTVLSPNSTPLAQSCCIPRILEDLAMPMILVTSSPALPSTVPATLM